MSGGVNKIGSVWSRMWVAHSNSEQTSPKQNRGVVLVNIGVRRKNSQTV